MRVDVAVLVLVKVVNVCICSAVTTKWPLGTETYDSDFVEVSEMCCFGTLVLSARCTIILVMCSCIY